MVADSFPRGNSAHLWATRDGAVAAPMLVPLQERLPGRQQTSAGEREVKKALCKTPLKYQLHTNGEPFERAYGYIRQHQ